MLSVFSVTFGNFLKPNLFFPAFIVSRYWYQLKLQNHVLYCAAKYFAKIMEKLFIFQDKTKQNITTILNIDSARTSFKQNDTKISALKTTMEKNARRSVLLLAFPLPLFHWIIFLVFYTVTSMCVVQWMTVLVFFLRNTDFFWFILNCRSNKVSLRFLICLQVIEWTVSNVPFTLINLLCI